MQCCCLRHPFTSSVRADSCARLLSRGIAKLIRQADDDEKYNQESHADGAIADEYAAMEAEEAGAPASAMAAATGEVLEVGIILYPLTHPLPPHTPPSLSPYITPPLRWVSFFSATTRPSTASTLTLRARARGRPRATSTGLASTLGECSSR